MRNLYFGAALFFTLSMALTSCGGNDQSNAQSDDDSSVQVSRKSIANDATALSIAYYNQDSIAVHFDFYREVDSMLRAKEMQFQKELESRIRSYQAYEADIQRRMDNNEITGYQLEDIQKTAAQKQQSISRFEQQRGTELQQETMEYQTALMNKLAQAGKEFSEKNQIDMLFTYQKGGQITYIANSFDVTEQYINYLNKREEELMADFDEEVESVEVAQDSLGQ